MSFAFKPATAELNKVAEFPEAKSANETLIISSCTTPSITHNGFVSPKIDEDPRTVI